MRRAALAISVFLLSCLAGGAVAARAPDRARAARAPVVVELFTAQGCSSCVVADKVLDGIASRPGVLALTLAVDYWDYLGWDDTFARPEFSARQRAYMQKLALREVYTPQMVVDGKVQAAGADRQKVEALIREAQRSRAPAPAMRMMRRGRLQIGTGRAPRGGADVWLVRYSPGVQEVAVKRGENRGQVLSQRNVVRELVKVGRWAGKSRIYALPPASGDDQALKTAILVQAADGGRIVGILLR